MLTAFQQANLAWEGVVTDMVESLTELLVCLINSSECDSTFGYGYFPKSWLVINRTLSDNICLGLLLELELDMMNCYQNLTTFRDRSACCSGGGRASIARATHSCLFGCSESVSCHLPILILVTE